MSGLSTYGVPEALRWDALMSSVTTGQARHDESVKQRRRLRAGPRQGGEDEEQFEVWDIQGAMAEHGVAQVLGFPRPTHVNRFNGDGADVGPYEVESVSELRLGLMYRPTGHPTRVYVLGLVWQPWVVIRGWMYGADIAAQGRVVRKAGWPDAWVMAPERLHPLSTLPSPDALGWPGNEWRDAAFWRERG